MDGSLESLIDALKAAGEMSRLRALAALRQGELSVGELAQILGLSQPRLSQHMKLLTLSGLVERLPEGAWVFYRLAAEGPARALADAILNLLGENHPQLQRDQERLVHTRAQRQAAAQAYFANSAAQWDRIRDEFYPGLDLEAALLAAAGPGPFEFMIDLGVGTGRLLAAFAGRVKTAEGIDLSHPMLAIARAELEEAGLAHLRVRRGDILDLPFAESVADLVTLQQVLHYLDQPERAVAEALRVLRPGGLALIADFAPHQEEALRTEHAHRRLGFEDSEIRAWAQAAGAGAAALEPVSLPRAGGRGLEVKIWRLRKASPGTAATRNDADRALAK